MSEVFWIDSDGMSADNTVAHKLRKLITETGATDNLEEGMRVAIKINTSEDGYEYGLRPVFIRTVAQDVQKIVTLSPTICDGLKLIDYGRKTKGHAFKDVANSKGYTASTLSGSFSINGGFSGNEANSYMVKADDSMLGGVEVGTAICRADALMVLSHVTLHPLFGVSGALFNGGFESLVCKERIRILDGLSTYNFNGEPPPKDRLQRFQQRALEGHLGVREALNGKIFYINYLWDITPEPEYYPYSGSPIVKNIGFLASSDPVALDSATHGLICEYTQGNDPVTDQTAIDFKEVLREAVRLELGSLEYTIKRSS